MDFMLYPTFEIVEGRGLIPNVRLPRNYKELVPRFYDQDRRKEIEEYARMLEETSMGGILVKSPEIRLQWEDKRGLTNISIGVSGGFDLNESGWPSFQEHNLGTNTSLMGGSIAMKYVSELMKSRK
ncbi:hypothetical protein CMI42_01725 [Candidatus Pacearchaeota archaeon]|nr:hypothetical protein [Candidatus Pacearchaeota archaeon]